MTVNVNVNVDVNELLWQCGISGSKENYNDRVDVIDPGDRFISTCVDGIYCAYYYHPTRKHSATVQGRSTATSTANAGLWAFAKADKNLGGNKTFYNVL